MGEFARYGAVPSSHGLLFIEQKVSILETRASTVDLTDSYEMSGTSIHEMFPTRPNIFTVFTTWVQELKQSHKCINLWKTAITLCQNPSTKC